MSLLAFLQTSTIEDAKAPARGGGGKSKQWQPNPAHIAVRLWKDGSVFPSKAAVDKYDLEYKDAVITKEAIPARAEEKDATGKVTVKAREAGSKNVYSYPNGVGNGLDVIPSTSWTQFKAEGGAMLFVAVTPKDQAKIDLFSTANYDDAGKPKTSVEEQGAATYGKDVLIPLVEEIYGIKFQRDAREAKGDAPAVTAQEGVEFVDLVIFESIGEGVNMFNVTETYSKNIILIPKRIARGEDKGKDDYERRENVKVYGFAPLAMVFPAEAGTSLDENQDKGNDPANTTTVTEKVPA